MVEQNHGETEYWTRHWLMHDFAVSQRHRPNRENPGIDDLRSAAGKPPPLSPVLSNNARYGRTRIRCPTHVRDPGRPAVGPRICEHV
jgi:hypothetical protein